VNEEKQAFSVNLDDVHKRQPANTVLALHELDSYLPHQYLRTANDMADSLGLLNENEVGRRIRLDPARPDSLYPLVCTSQSLSEQGYIEPG
jgi:hypothetical protein